MSFTINVHTRDWPVSARVDTAIEGGDLAWLTVETRMGHVSILGTVDRIEAMRRAAAALNDAFGELEAAKEAAE
jgi:hypothetical protein